MISASWRRPRRSARPWLPPPQSLIVAATRCILVHRRELLAQWVERLKRFLSVEAADIGTIGGGRRKPTGCIDVALIQSLVRKGEDLDLIAGYGHLVVDECHHISASTFEMVACRSKARYVLGPLSDDHAQGWSPSNHFHAVWPRTTSRQSPYASRSAEF